MRSLPTLTLLSFFIAACNSADAAPEASRALASAADQSLPAVLVYKSPSCGCCNGWIEHMRAAGFAVDARDVTDLMSVKRDAGVPVAMSSCHTALIDGYVVEGHVPAEQVKRLLADRPDMVGIAAPGMPLGSPGMESANPQPYEVFSFDHDGRTQVFAEVDPR